MVCKMCCVCVVRCRVKLFVFMGEGLTSTLLGDKPNVITNLVYLMGEGLKLC